MAASRPSPSPSPSPASPHFTVLKHDHHAVKPNPHPYAIRTTSTGVLTRSNSSGHNTAASRHHYVPLPPTSPTRARSHHHQHHKHAKSLNTDEAYFDGGVGQSPQPLPVPSRFLKHASQEDLHANQEASRVVRRRAETLPGPLTSDSTLAPAVPAVEGEADLPANPKLWTPAQLAAYLLENLSSDGEGESVKAGDVARFVQETKLSGRVFLRLDGKDMVACVLSFLSHIF